MKKKLVVAVGLALIAVLSLWLYSRSLQEEVAGGQKVQILVAGEDIAAGVRVTKAMLAVREVPEAYVHQASIHKGEENQIIGRPVAEKVAQGQPLLWSDFELQKSAQSRRLAGAVQKGQRALTIPVDMSGSLAGMLRPGDHVDILGTFARAQGTDWATVTLLQNVLVIATGDLRGTGEGEEAPVGGGGGPRTFNNITVSVDLEEAELLVFSMQRGPINMALRSQEDLETVEDVPDKNFGDIFEAQKRTAFARRHATKKIEALKAQ
jgi:pilus assembly protein CpaB